MTHSFWIKPFFTKEDIENVEKFNVIHINKEILCGFDLCKVNKQNMAATHQMLKELFPAEEIKYYLNQSIKHTCEIVDFIEYYVIKIHNEVVGCIGLYVYHQYPTDAWIGWFGVKEKWRQLRINWQNILQSPLLNKTSKQELVNLSKQYTKSKFSLAELLLEYVTMQAKNKNLTHLRAYTDIVDDKIAIPFYVRNFEVFEQYKPKKDSHFKINTTWTISKSLTNQKPSFWNSKHLYMQELYQASHS